MHAKLWIRAGSFVVAMAVSAVAAGLKSGQTLQGTVTGEKTRQTWKVEIRLLTVSPSGEVRGEMACPSLNAVLAIRGTSTGNIFTFTETEAIKAGKARVGCEYALIVEGATVRGRWIDPGRDWGTIDLTAGSGPNIKEPALTAGMKFEGSVASEKAKRNFPATLEITSVNAGTGAIQGTLTWPGFNAVHRIEGSLDGPNVSFKETAYVKKGSAHLNCEYRLTLKGAALSGSWQEPGYDKGTVALKLQ